MSKVVSFPADRYFDMDEFLADMELQGEKEFVVCEYAMRLLSSLSEEIERETNNVVAATDKSGVRSYYISADKMKSIILEQLAAPTL